MVRYYTPRLSMKSRQLLWILLSTLISVCNWISHAMFGTVVPLDATENKNRHFLIDLLTRVVLYMHVLLGRLRGLAVACRTTDHCHPCSNLGVGISEGCFNFDFASLPLKVARPI